VASPALGHMLPQLLPLLIMLVCTYLCEKCAGSACRSPPPDDAPNSTGWPGSCEGTAVGRSCRATCNTAAGATGNGYTARCTGTDVWEVTGSCTSELKTAAEQ
jgi:hypothetical protein